MLISETLESGFIRHYSDVGFDVKQNETGEIYQEAVDAANSPYTYSEVETDEELTAEEALQIILGGEPDESD